MTTEPSSTLAPDDYVYPSPPVIECPFAFYEALRADAPVHILPNGDAIVSRWDDLAYVVQHPEVFSSLVGPTNEHVLGGPRVGGDDSGPWTLSFCDDPEHKRNRLLNAFVVSGDHLRAYEPIIRRVADTLIDGFAARGEAEFRSEFATPLPRRVMMEIMALPEADDDRFARWFGGQGPRGARLASPEQQEDERRNRRELAEYMRELIIARADGDGTDYLSELTRAQIARDGEIDVPYLVTEGVGMFGAAAATTAHFIANTMLVLLERPDELARVRDDHDRLRPLLEEVLRVESPVQWSSRVTAVDTELHGVTIPSGSNVLLFWGSANRDASTFEDPEQLQVGRPGVAKRHMAFGYGMHRCIGAPLARLEAVISFEQVLDRLAGLRLADGAEIVHIQAMNQRAPLELPIRFDPA
jgi:cytochrome P450